MVATIAAGLAYAANNGALPSHVADNYIIGFGFRDGSNAAPSSPGSGGSHPWAGVIDSGGGNGCSYVLDYFKCTGSSHDSGTFTNATSVMFLCITGADLTSPLGGHTETNDSGAIATYGTVSMSVTDGTSRVLGLIGCRAETASANNAPTGMTNIYDMTNVGSGGRLAVHQTTGGVSSWSSQTAAITIGSGLWTVTLEIISAVGGSSPKGGIMMMSDHFNGGTRLRRPGLVQVRWPGLLSPKRPRLLLPSHLKKAA